MPSMIISLADVIGNGNGILLFGNGSSPNPGLFSLAGGLNCPSCGPINGAIPTADGFADPVPGTPFNWFVYILGNGPDPRAASGAAALTFGTPTNTQKIVMSLDATIWSGLTVDYENSVYW